MRWSTSCSRTKERWGWPSSPVRQQVATACCPPSPQNWRDWSRPNNRICRLCSATGCASSVPRPCHPCEEAMLDVSDKSPRSVGFSPRGSVLLREAWAKAHATSTSVGNVIFSFSHGWQGRGTDEGDLVRLHPWELSPMRPGLPRCEAQGIRLEFDERADTAALFVPPGTAENSPPFQRWEKQCCEPPAPSGATEHAARRMVRWSRGESSVVPDGTGWNI